MVAHRGYVVTHWGDKVAYWGYVVAHWWYTYLLIEQSWWLIWGCVVGGGLLVDIWLIGGYVGAHWEDVLTH